MDDTRSRIRRQRSLSPTRELAAEMSPLNGQGGGFKRSSVYAIGSFLVPSMFQIKVRDKSDASAKKKFQVNVPSKMLVVLGLVFLLMPLSVFYYKEKHIHEDHHEAHFKQQKFVNVDKKQALANFRANQNVTSEMTSQDMDQTSAKTSTDEAHHEAHPVGFEESETVNTTETTEGHDNQIDGQQNATTPNGDE